MHDLSFFLCKGMMLALFHIDGKQPVCGEVLKSLQRLADSWLTPSFKSLGLIPSGPNAFDVSSCNRHFSTSQTRVVNSSSVFCVNKG